MAPKSPWKQKAAVNGQNTAVAGEAAPPSPMTMRMPVPPPANYAQVQAEEVEALRAIFMHDYEEGPKNPAAWGKTTDRAFKLTIRPTSEHAKEADFVVLCVKLTATYPRSAPVLEVQGLDKFHDRTQKRIRDVLQGKPKEMQGGVMIHDIALDIQDRLEEAVAARAKGALPSLDEERASAEEVALNLAREAEKAEERRLRELQEEESRVFNQRVQQEVNRGNKRMSLNPSSDTPRFEVEQKMPNTIVFEQRAKIMVGNESEHFTEVHVDRLLFQGGKESVYLGKPKVATTTGSPAVAIVRRKVEKRRDHIIELEAALEAAREFDHPSLVNLLAFRVDRINNYNSELILCREYADRGSLHELLSFCDLHTSKSRQFATQLLEGLEYLHRNGVTHGGISTRRIYLSTSPTMAPKLADFGYASILGLRTTDLPGKWRSPDSESTSWSSHRYADLWDLGTVIVQMFLGLTIVDDYRSPSVLLDGLDLSANFEDFLKKIFLSDAKKRPSCFDLLPAEFLRTETPVMQTSTRSVQRSRKSSSGIASPSYRRSRHNSSSLQDVLSRYASDFTELGRLGKGGFGEVVKARHKLDAGVFAVKKIRQTPQLVEQVLKEVLLLNRLNHPYVVRYYSTWVESDTAGSTQEEAVSTADATLSNGPNIDFPYTSTGGHDFVSSSGPGLEFGPNDWDDDDDEDDEDEENNDEYDNDDDDYSEEDIFERDSKSNDEEDIFERDSKSNGLDGTSTVESEDGLRAGDLRLNRPRSDSRRAMSTLYIQMELCDRRSLRDLIRRPMPEDHYWRIMRQITEGLAHIHDHGIIHRDLKPDNVFIDKSGNPKIGDFGLATPGNPNNSQVQLGSKGFGSVDMTRSIGTALYVAPELQSNSGSTGDVKIDMYSLGITFFEMCQPFGTNMERHEEINKIRQKKHELPAAFQANGEKAAQGNLINLLISHKPSERPTSAQLLLNGMLPVNVGDEAIRKALEALSDPHSRHHHETKSALFARDASRERVKARAWEAKAGTNDDDVNRVRMRGSARHTLLHVFRRHGGEEIRRDTIFPRSELYPNNKVVQFLDPSGNILQLPYDLTVPKAQELARQKSRLRCTFTFGGAYRDKSNGGPPIVAEEADFDIVSSRDEDIVFDDAEAIKVMDEVFAEIPAFEEPANVRFQLNHGKLLDAVLEHCRVPLHLQHLVKGKLSELGVQQNTWSTIRPELRNMGLSDTTLDDLKQFDWRDAPDKAFVRIQSLFHAAEPRAKSKSDEAIQHLRGIFRIAQKFRVTRKLFLAPLSCMNAKLYANGLLFQCMLEKKKPRVIAAGGRYDSLIDSYRVPGTDVPKQGAVGVTIGMDYLVTHLLRICSPGTKSTFLKDPRPRQLLPKRCEVLVRANDTENLRIAGIELVSKLWESEISAELSHDSFEEQDYIFIIHMRHETSTSVRVTKTTTDAEDTDVPLQGLISHLLQDLHRNKTRGVLQRNHSSHQEGDRKIDNIDLLIAQHRKRTNKSTIIEGIAKSWSEREERTRNPHILGIETRDEVLDLIKDTRLGDAESWKKALQRVPLNEREYFQKVQQKLDSWRTKWIAGDFEKEIGVCNFRSGSCIVYDLSS